MCFRTKGCGLDGERVASVPGFCRGLFTDHKRRTLGIEGNGYRLKLAPGPQGRQTLAHGVSRGIRSTLGFPKALEGRKT